MAPLRDEWFTNDEDKRQLDREAQILRTLRLGAERYAGETPVAIPMDGLEVPCDPLATYANGKYLLIRELGAGGMAIVYEAFKSKDPKRETFALKIIKPEHGDMIYRELENLQKVKDVDSEFVIKVFEVDADHRCLEMQLLQGMTLRQRLKETGRIVSPFELLTIGQQIAEALRAVHAAGIVHRDVKPDNIFLTNRHGGIRAVLLDFGIAVESEARRTLSQAALAGTPIYLPPADEWERPDQESMRSNDLFMLGKTLFEMLTGKLPGAHAPGWETLYPEIRDATYRLFHDNPLRRPVSAAEVIQTLRFLIPNTILPKISEIWCHSLKWAREIALKSQRDQRRQSELCIENITFAKTDASGCPVAELKPSDGQPWIQEDRARDVLQLGQAMFFWAAGVLPPPGTEYSHFAKNKEFVMDTDEFQPLLRTLCRMTAMNPQDRLPFEEINDRLYRLEQHLIERSHK
ncbi:MAG: Serine/threonine-protein kinase [Planctomycetaceae bacterium]|nr:Serine/threonine-protein kinase [Planctomycetaceae bacterium]